MSSIVIQGSRIQLSLVVICDGGLNLYPSHIGLGRFPQKGHVAQLHRSPLVHDCPQLGFAAPSVRSFLHIGRFTYKYYFFLT